MSNLWAALLADEGDYHFFVPEKAPIPTTHERRFDRMAMRYPFTPVCRTKKGIGSSGVLWATLPTGRSVDTARGFYRPPTVLFTKGRKGVALWAIEPLPATKTHLANELLARTFKGRIKDADPWAFALDLRGMSPEWRTDCLYDSQELVSRL
jgi:hypothetical protein